MRRENERVSIEHLDLPSGYSVEPRGKEIYLKDPKGRTLMWLPDGVTSADRQRIEHAEYLREQNVGVSKELFRALLDRLSQQIAEDEILCDRVSALGERLKAAEEERDQANAIAETLYDDYFREHLRIAAARKRRLRS